MIHIRLFSDYRFNSEARAFEVLKFLIDSDFAPTKYGTSESASEAFSLTNMEKPLRMLSGSMVDYLSGEIFLKGDEYSLLYWIRWSVNAYTNWYIQLDDKYFEDEARVDKFVTFISDLSQYFQILYGGVAPEEDWDAKHWYTRKTKNMTTREYVGHELQSCLPGIYWLTIMGDSIVQQLGEETIKSLDVHRMIEFSPTGIGIMQSPSPYAADKETRLTNDKEIIKTLGSQYFFDLDNRKRKCDALDLPAQKLPKSGRYDELENLIISEPFGEPYTNIEDIAEGFVGAFHNDIDALFQQTLDALKAIDDHFEKNPPRIEYNYSYLLQTLIPGVGAFLGQVLVANNLGEWQIKDPLVTSIIVCNENKALRPFRIAHQVIFGNRKLVEVYHECEK